MKIYDLKPINGRKSFNGNASVIEHDNGVVELKSYNTIVCRIVNGSFERLWDGYSATTMNHINAFCDLFGIDSFGKSWWESLKPVTA